MTITHSQTASPSSLPCPDSPAIEMSGVAVKFRLPTDRIHSFKEYVLGRLTSRVDYREIWALRSVDLTVRSGETFGIVGRNGAGKSTLLKVMSRVLRPTTGRVVIRGRLAPLLELGAGFHPDLTGEENLFMNAAILGHPRRQVKTRLQEAIEFAELQDFIQAPIRTYSSGMQARLGFAVATLFRPDILVLDEVLAVGDLGFQQKCLERIEQFRAQGTAIVLVSHALDSVARHCDRAAWIDSGKIVSIGSTEAVLTRYREIFQAP